VTLSWARAIQSMLLHATTSRSIFILSSHLRLNLPSGLFLSDIPTKTLYAVHISPIIINGFVYVKTSIKEIDITELKIKSLTLINVGFL
jgi:hypothetical protein